MSAKLTMAWVCWFAIGCGGEDMPIGSDDDAGRVASDAGGGFDAGRVVEIDAGGGVDAGMPEADAGMMSMADAGTSDGGSSCDGMTCGAGERCVVECCEPTSMCTWVASGEMCPEGLHPVARDFFPCPPFPGRPMDQLCIAGMCPMHRPRSCKPVADGECTGMGSACPACTEQCYGQPSAVDPAIVSCRWVG